MVVYVYAETDAESRNNLRFFLQHGVRPDDGAHYVVTVQSEDAVLATALESEVVQDNVRFLSHLNVCYDWGTFGWVVRSKIITSAYKYFIMLNSSVRGPFLPPYMGPVTWHKLFTQRLNSDVLIVGPTVSCEGTPNRLNMSEIRQNPHVQSFVIATNRAGFKTLLQDGNVLKCWSERLDAIYHAELGASAAVLRAGYNLGCLLQR
ncbi:hypothetical protein WJX81_003889 [Elliptochloris bilobata]|uniref:Uncharacterized protein n=1 Tax=Elliptochloris bilobata TaxID=381761 RepID=A0AAW1QYD3_9CHLO